MSFHFAPVPTTLHALIPRYMSLVVETLTKSDGEGAKERERERNEEWRGAGGRGETQVRKK